MSLNTEKESAGAGKKRSIEEEKELYVRLARQAWENATCLFSFVDVPSMINLPPL